MISQKKMTKSNINTSNNSANNCTDPISTNSNSTTTTNTTNSYTRKPRRSIKVEGNCLNGMLREGTAHVIDASKLGKRLSSEIWNSFGAIQVPDTFLYPSIETKTVADGSSTVKICQFFVACSKCFSVFKYDGHAYGTTGLVKHVKICQGTNQVGITRTSTTTTNTVLKLDHSVEETHISSLPIPNNQISSPTTLCHTSTQQPVTNTCMFGAPAMISQQQQQRRKSVPRTRATQPNLKLLVKAIEELRCEQNELKQKIHDLINMMSASSYVGQIQIISNDGDKVEDELQKTD